MSIKRFIDLLIQPHPLVTNPETARVVRLLTAYHLFTIPIAPVVAIIRPELPAAWTLGIFTCCVMFYITFRTRWAAFMINVQLLLALLIPALTTIIEPDRQSVHFAYLVPVLLSTLLYPLRYLYVVSGLSLTCFLVMNSFFPSKDPTLASGSLVLLSVLIAMVILEASCDGKNSSGNSARRRTRTILALVNATFDGTATISNGVFTSVSDGFSSTFSVR